MLSCDLVRAAAAPPLPATWPTHVLFLHGLGDSKDGWKPVLAELDLPGVAGLFVQAPLPYPPDDPFGWSWFDMAADRRPHDAHIRAHRSELRELLTRLEKDHGVAAERLAIIGFSQGAVMALDLALRHDRAFAAVVAISGWPALIEEYPRDFAATLPRQRILVTHGHADPVVPIHLSEPRVKALQAMGAPLTWRTYPKAHHLDQQELIDMRAFLTAAKTV